jgi:tetratricopeptide (TPR) repeat protein
MVSNPTVNSEPTPTMTRAMELLRAGRTVEAEEVVVEAVEQASQRFGSHSAEHAHAQGELGSVLLAVGQLDRAAAAFRAACDGPAPRSEQDLRDRLTHLMTLGQVLDMAGRLDEAEQALSEGLAGREKYYGRDHPGYAFGLEPLAELMLKRGKGDLAMEMIQEVIANFGRSGHPRIAGAIALRAEVLRAVGKTDPPFQILKKLPDDLVQQVVQKTLDRAGRSQDLTVNRSVLAALLPTLGESHANVLDVLAAISNVERRLGQQGDPTVRQRALQRIIDIHDARHRAREALQATLGLALAQSDAGQHDDAIATYHRASVRAEQLGDAGQRSQVLRNLGLLLADIGRTDEAEQRLRAAMMAGAEGALDATMLARARVALGIFLQHVGRLDEAAPLLKAATNALEPADPDAITARSHLRAIESGGSCGCGDVGETAGQAVADAFREFVTARLPADLLAHFDVAVKEGDFEIGVHLKREATEPELAHIERVVNHALNEFRRKLISGT